MSLLQGVDLAVGRAQDQRWEGQTWKEATGLNMGLSFIWVVIKVGADFRDYREAGETEPAPRET